MSRLTELMQSRIKQTEELTGKAVSGDWSHTSVIAADGEAKLSLEIKGKAGASEVFGDPARMARAAETRRFKGKDKDSGESSTLSIDFQETLANLPGAVPGRSALDDYRDRMTRQDVVESGEDTEAEKLERELTEV